MPRPLHPRKACHNPRAFHFKPAGIPLQELGEVILSADELESLRLADFEQLHREDAANLMSTSRQTFECTVRGARLKLVEALVKGWAIRIEIA